MRFFNKIVCYLSILLLLFSSLSVVSAKENDQVKVEVTNFKIPVIGQAPSFDFDIIATDENSNNFNEVALICWIELDLSIDETHELISTIFDTVMTIANSNPDPDSDIEVLPEIENQDYYKEKLKKIRILLNKKYGSMPSESVTSEIQGFKIEISTLDKFLPNKTYLALFATASIIDPINDGTVLLAANPSSGRGNTLLGANPSNNPKSSPNETLIDTDLDLSINGKSKNVKGAYLNNNGQKEIIMYALYNAIPPYQDIKATVNWHASKDKIPNSLVLKLMKGSNVVKEQVITKETAIKDDVWEYSFTECPTVDENGNEITYTLDYEETNEGDLRYFNTEINGFTMDNTFEEPEINSNVKMKSILNRDSNNVKYRIDYSALVNNYSGDADVYITTTLSYSIDASKSDLDGGVYDDATKSIIWKEELKNIDKEYKYSTTKNVTVYSTAVLPYSIDAKTVGQVQLKDADEYSTSTSTDNHIDYIGNPKTGDINIIKYLSIALVGIGTVLMVIQIKRKNSTKKNIVLF